MASTTALFTGLSGLNANARNIDVIGNNIANVNTTAYKSSRLMFSTVFSRDLSLGSAPSDTAGGTNPYQIGYGVKTAGTQRNTTGGSVSATGDQRDLAIDGAGYFVVNRDGQDLYTRAGSFRQNSVNDLVAIGGEKLRGYGVDAQFNLTPGLVDLNIPIGSLTVAEATRNVRFSGNLNADGPLPAQGSRISLRATATAGLVAAPGAAPAPTPPNLIEDTTRLTDLEDPLLPATAARLFSAGQTLEVRGAEKGNKTLPTAGLAITSGTTVADLNDFLTAALGIDTSVGPNPDGNTPGVTTDPATGALMVVGNTGTVSDLVVDQTDLRLLSAGGAVVRYPFNAAKGAAADGESVRTTFVAFDSLGTPVEIDVSMVLDARTSSGTTWRYFVESGDDTDVALQVGTGTIEFDTQGQPVSTLPVTVTLDRANTGADSPMVVDIAFASDPGGVTALSDDHSELAATSRDGAPIGTLSNFAVGPDGVIYGSFTNGTTRVVGQVAVATFANAEGLLDLGSSMFQPGANSGTAVVPPAGSSGPGTIIGGALELSNVDLGEEFIKLILSSTGYSASSRVIRTADELMQQLLVLGR